MGGRVFDFLRKSLFFANVFISMSLYIMGGLGAKNRFGALGGGLLSGVG